MGNSPKEVLECTANKNDTPCPLFSFRLGKIMGRKPSHLKGKGIPKGLLAYQSKKVTLICEKKPLKTAEEPKGGE